MKIIGFISAINNVFPNEPIGINCAGLGASKKSNTIINPLLGIMNRVR